MRRVRLNENQLNRLVANCVKQVLRESALDSDQMDTLEEKRGWIETMMDMFDINGQGCGDEDVEYGTVSLPWNPSWELSYQIVDYGTPNQGIECDIDTDDDDVEEISGWVRQQVMGNGFFQLDDDFDPSPYFYRFRLVAPY